MVIGARLRNTSASPTMLLMKARTGLHLTRCVMATRSLGYSYPSDAQYSIFHMLLLKRRSKRSLTQRPTLVSSSDGLYNPGGNGRVTSLSSTNHRGRQLLTDMSRFIASKKLYVLLKSFSLRVTALCEKSRRMKMTQMIYRLN